MNAPLTTIELNAVGNRIRSRGEMVEDIIWSTMLTIMGFALISNRQASREAAAYFYLESIPGWPVSAGLVIIILSVCTILGRYKGAYRLTLVGLVGTAMWFAMHGVGILLASLTQGTPIFSAFFFVAAGSVFMTRAITYKSIRELRWSQR